MFTLNRCYAALIPVLLIATLAGCASSVRLDEVPADAKTPVVTAPPPRPAEPAPSRPQSSIATVDLGKAAPDVNLVGRIVFFDFDSFVVKEEFRPIIETHSRSLVSNRQKRIVVEGHTDERGGREYNLALGQKRAEAVQRTMLLMGAGDTQIEAISYGEERPNAAGSDEASWAKNRRAELKDR